MSNEELTENEATVYDRQLRVWGVEVQRRLNAAKILIAGMTSGVAAEVAKNTALAGVGSLSLLDDTPCSPDAAPCNFLIPADFMASQSVAEASAATLREMNPLVRIEALPGGVAEQPDTDFLSGFDVILLPQAPLSMQLAYDKACTEVNVAFFTAYSRGTVAYFFENLHVHEHTPMDAPSGAPLQKSLSSFTPLESALHHPWNKLSARFTHKLVYALRVCSEFALKEGRPPVLADLEQLQSRAQQLGREAASQAAADHPGKPLPKETVSEDVLPTEVLEELVTGDTELPPVNAVLGGVLANEILKVVSHKGDPVNNFFFFSLMDNVGQIETLG
ncbi:g4547 [Coccomyxa viridis]|uniref:G4547 protein n=1 Tax=Coccomyxa viridis TaxID=1274662 RepID=A0ABP1FQI9_9CHLO